MMDFDGERPPKPRGSQLTKEERNRIVAQARQAQDERMKGYRERSLSIHPWVCARCGREFTNKNLHLLTVHHKDHNHDNNPADGSNWENLCIYCHDNEHSRYIDHVPGDTGKSPDKEVAPVTHRPFAALADMLKKTEK
ncbi:MAG: YajD family HNH nuclease [Desulfatiglans sp.]|nr:YajD family HNH nuclease [Desulfatiglans sp.]